MAEFPALPLFTDAYIGDTQHLTNEEHGVYLRLLMFAWRTPDCALPDDDKRLCLMVGVTAKKWASLKPTVMSFWSLTEGRWKQKKLTAQREFVERSREQKRAAGIASSTAKALRSNETGSTAVVQPLPTAGVTELPTERQQPISIPIEEDKSSSSLSEKGSDETAKSGRREVYPEAFEAFWEAYPRTPNMSKLKTADAWKKLTVERRIACHQAIPAYRAFLASKINHPTMHATTFINERRFEGFAPEVSKPVDVAVWEKRLNFGRTNEKWESAKWGPAPGSPGCLVPAVLLRSGDGDGWKEWGAAA